jgi:hypothetical protein
VIAAKLLAGLLIALASVAVCLATSLAATALVAAIGHGNGTFDVAASGLASAVLFTAMWMVAGAALGLLVMRSAPAIVLSFLIPGGIAGIAAGIPGAERPLRWIDLGTVSRRAQRRPSGGVGHRMGVHRERCRDLGAGAARDRVRPAAPRRGDVVMRFRVLFLKVISRVAQFLRVFPPS